MVGNIYLRQGESILDLGCGMSDFGFCKIQNLKFGEKVLRIKDANALMGVYILKFVYLLPIIDIVPLPKRARIP